MALAYINRVFTGTNLLIKNLKKINCAMTQSKNIDPVSKSKRSSLLKQLFFISDGAGVDNGHAKDGGQKLEIRRGKWLDAAI